MDVQLDGLRHEARDAALAQERLDGVVIGRVVRGGDGVEVLVDYPGNPCGGPVSAVSTVRSSAADVGREIALAFQEGDPERPMVLGFIQSPRRAPAPPAEAEEAPTTPDTTLTARVDDERLVLTAEREIVLKCGKASLTLTRSGKVLIRGKYLLSRSSGVNRIKGGSVQIN